LPNLKFLVCGILFCFFLFAVAGTGVMLPDARTHIGEMPQIGRPMMRRSMADSPEEAHVYMMAARRSDGPDRIREPVPMDTAAPQLPEPDAGEPELSTSLAKPGPSKPGLPKPDMPTVDGVPEEPSESARIVTLMPAGSPDDDGSPALTRMTTQAPLQIPVKSPAEVPVAAASPATPAAETRTSGSGNDAGPPQAAEDGDPGRRFAGVPFPPSRPAFVVRRRVLHRRHRVVQQQDAAIQGVPAGPGVARTSPGPIVTGPVVTSPVVPSPP
jgi:hypothetical protein